MARAVIIDVAAHHFGGGFEAFGDRCALAQKPHVAVEYVAVLLRPARHEGGHRPASVLRFRIAVPLCIVQQFADNARETRSSFISKLHPSGVAHPNIEQVAKFIRHLFARLWGEVPICRS